MASICGKGGGNEADCIPMLDTGQQTSPGSRLQLQVRRLVEGGPLQPCRSHQSLNSRLEARAVLLAGLVQEVSAWSVSGACQPGEMSPIAASSQVSPPGDSHPLELRPAWFIGLLSYHWVAISFLFVRENKQHCR